MDPTSLELLAARYSIGTALSDDIRAAADQALLSGSYSPSLVELAETRHPILSTIGPLFETALAELGTGVPSRDQAVRTIARHHLARIVAGDTQPRDGLSDFMQDVYYPVYVRNEPVQLGDNVHGLQDFIACFWTYDHLDDVLAEEFADGKVGEFGGFKELERTVRRLAREWLSKNET